jgi:hypothetical protein
MQHPKGRQQQPTGTIEERNNQKCLPKIAQENMREDLGRTMQILHDMRAKDNRMTVKFKLDKEGKLTSMLWSTGKNKDDYERFGDAITFDKTYSTNLYKLPFGLFVGVNNHFQSVIFGGLLLTTETTEDFEWGFSNFVDIMGGKAPQTMLTG